MENIISGNLISPSSVSIPTVQSPLRPDQPITYGRGESFSVYVKYPVGTKRLLFTINNRTFSTSPPLFQQIVFPNPKEGGVAEFFVDTATTLKFSAGLYYWDIFQLRDDGSRDIWSPYNTGTFSVVEFPSSNFLDSSPNSINNNYNNEVSIPLINSADFIFPGILFADREFGGFVVPEGYSFSAYGANAWVFTPSSGSDIVLGIVDLSNNSQLTSYTIILAEGQNYATTTFDEPLLMRSQTSWALKVLSVGSDFPGEYLSCRLLLNLVH
jgi:hypothetical protein